MYFDQIVDIPQIPGITKLRKPNITYIRYAVGRIYNRDKQYTVPQHKIIGKQVEGDETKMHPNENYEKYLPDFANEKLLINPMRSMTLKVGTFFVMRHVMRELDLHKKLLSFFDEKQAGKILDLAAYSIVTEGNKAEYYPMYTFDHPLFTEQMHRYGDSSVSNLLQSITDDQTVGFRNQLNAEKDHNQEINLSYNSTNKYCQAGDIEMVKTGHSKNGQSQPIFNYAIGYDLTNQEPLFYEWYPGDIPDISELEFMVNKVTAYGYKKITFIMDRGYFSEQNLRYIDGKEFFFIIMCKGCKDLVSEVIRSNRGTFESDRECKINSEGVYGTTVIRELAGKDRWFHLYHSTIKEHLERVQLESKIDQERKVLEKLIGSKIKSDSAYKKHFILEIDPKDGTLVCFGEDKEAIEAELNLCGYFAIITSREMNAQDAYRIYKSRDTSEKLFSGDKTFLGDAAIRVGSTESASAKIFIEFLALMVRSRMYTELKDEKEKIEKEPNFMTVPGAVAELELIQMTKGADGRYRLDFAISKNQKMILKAFGMTAAEVKKETELLADELKNYEAGESAENAKNGGTENEQG